MASAGRALKQQGEGGTMLPPDLSMTLSAHVAPDNPVPFTIDAVSGPQGLNLFATFRVWPGCSLRQFVALLSWSRTITRA
jgi:hypothetical protein